MSNIVLYNRDLFLNLYKVRDGSVDLIVADPPYGLGKDYGNDSDNMVSDEEYLRFTKRWVCYVLPKLKPTGSLYIFLSWQHTPEVFSWMKKKMTMVNEIIWNRRVPSQGGTTRKFTSVHDNIGLFVKSEDYYFNLDSIRIPYDAETKKKRSRARFEGQRWLEEGCNPKDLWSCSRLHFLHPERVDHPTQKPLEIINRMVRASCPPNGLVFDPFMGSGTTAVAAKLNRRNFVGFELNSKYCRIAKERISTPVQDSLFDFG